MKSVKGKLLKKLKTIKTIGYLKPERILQVNAADGLFDNFIAKPSNKLQSNQTHFVSEMQIEKKSVQEAEVIDVSELMKDLEEEDDDEFGVEEKENYLPISDKIGNQDLVNRNSRSFGGNPLSEIDISSFRPPDLDSSTLFDPNLLAAFQQAVSDVKAQEQAQEQEERINRMLDQSEDDAEEAERPSKSIKLNEFHEFHTPISEFEKICPPGGTESVILYTTGFRSIRKTFEDCSSIRFLLDSFKVLYHERDLSMHLGFRDELWRILGKKVVPPRLFIKGRYIGGAEEVLRLHEQGKFRPLLDGIPVSTADERCDGCGGVRFVVCLKCSGSRKVGSGDGGLPEKCRGCNENGLVMCPFCC